ncbi:MAG: PD-(D/E)XK nuclease family protein [Deltaproteobacteria bacterium]|nr:PD-(D/E)XK nuclease family protein [Deltaproteobacteria bacterium]
MESSTQIEHLENFVLSNPELDKLESLLSDFNIFETLKSEYTEVKHSNVIAWLLDPQENHGLASYFIRQFFKFVVSTNRIHFSSAEFSLVDFELFSYRNVAVRREWKNIDILIVVTEHDKKIVIALENKIKSSEHSDQLRRYRSIVEREFGDFTRFYIYLTPDNLIPSDDEWVSFNYNVVADLLDELLKNRKSSLSANVYSFISQYQTILRRYIVGNSEVERIAVEIYKKHKDALDIIFQHKPDVYFELSEHLQTRLHREKGIIIDSAGKTVIRFTTKNIDPEMKRVGEGWVKSQRILLFKLGLSEDRVSLTLHIGPGDDEYRKNLINVFLKDKKLFKKADRKFGTKWHAVYQSDFLRKKDFENDDIEDMKAKLDRKLDEFVNGDLPLIEQHFQTHWKK